MLEIKVYEGDNIDAIKRNLFIANKVAKESKFWVVSKGGENNYIDTLHKTNGKSFFILLTKKGRTVGSSSALYNPLYTCYMLDICLLKQYHGCGYGKALVKTLITQIRVRNKFKQPIIYLIVDKGNIFAVRLYLSLGFQFTGQIYDTSYGTKEHWMILNAI